MLDFLILPLLLVVIYFYFVNEICLSTVHFVKNVVGTLKTRMEIR